MVSLGIKATGVHLLASKSSLGLTKQPIMIQCIDIRLVRSFPEWQVMLIDHRGHGDSPNFQGPHTISNCAQDVLYVIVYLCIQLIQ